MSKNNYLTFAYFLSFSLICFPMAGYSQSEMDLLLFEKKNEAVSDEKPSTSLFSSLKGNNKEEKKENIDPNANANESWLKSLFKYGKKEILKTDEDAKAEEKIKETIIEKQKSNAAYFDISNVRLRMTPKEVEDVLIKQGYRKISENLEIPNFIEWRSEELCRINGIVGFERLNACATKIAKENGHQFVEKQIYSRYTTRETIEVNYSSSFTDNLSYRVFYKSTLPMSKSKASKNIYINNIKIFDFWRRIDLKYGKPDNASEIKWGMGGKKPYLQAKTGQLELFDPLLLSLDSTRMFNEDSRLSNTQYYTF